MAKYQIGDFVMHGSEVGKVVKIVKNFREMGDYYRIQSLNDDTLFVMTPVDARKANLRPVLSRDQAEQLIDEMVTIKGVEFDARNAETAYNDLIKTGDHRDMIRLIKTSYERCNERIKQGLTRNEKDKMFLRLGERICTASWLFRWIKPLTKLRNMFSSEFRLSKTLKSLSLLSQTQAYLLVTDANFNYNQITNLY